MLLQSIVQELDCELARLERLRSIVAGLSRTPAFVRRLTQSVETVPISAKVSVPLGKRPGRPRRTEASPRIARAVKPEPEPAERALARSIPAGPVVINPARLAEERARRQQSREAESAPRRPFCHRRSWTP
jgi:hypothetical protein